MVGLGTHNTKEEKARIVMEVLSNSSTISAICRKYKFERRWNESADFRNKFLEERKKKEEKILKNRIEKKRRLKENVSLEAEKSVQN